MTDEPAGYDAIAEGYATWWSPVHRPGTLGLLAEIEAAMTDGPRRVLDVGCGTGALAVQVASRWDRAEVHGIDASGGMLAIAAREADALPEDVRARLRFSQALADRLPFGDGSFDLVVSAFVLQLVPSRARALREIRRVLRPGGRLAYVTWLQGGEHFAADDVYDDVRREVGLEPRWAADDEDGGRADAANDVASPAAAIAQLRRAGFSDARARAEELVHRFTPEAFVGFVSRFDDEDEWDELEPGRREALEHLLLERLRAAPPEHLVMRMPIVFASGVRRA